MYGFQEEQIALVAIVWLLASASALARTYAPVRDNGERPWNNSLSSRVGFSCCAGFMAISYLGVLALAWGNDWIVANRFGIVTLTPFVGALGPEQQALFVNFLFTRATGMTKKQDDSEK